MEERATKGPQSGRVCWTTSKILQTWWTRNLATLKIDPNFFMTGEYIRFKGLEWVEEPNLTGWKDLEDSSQWFFPPWMVEQGRFAVKTQPYFAGFPDLPGFASQHLDRQYIYNPLKFEDLSGSEWKVYRKNLRKYPARIPAGTFLKYEAIEGEDYEDQIACLVESWCEGREIQDPEVLIKFCLFGRWRWGLFHDGTLVGLNVGDLNWKHVVFRYCIDIGEPFLQEYLRHQFYMNPWVVERASMLGMWVNDGGDLGQEGLRKFKERLNPARIQTIYSNLPGVEA